MQCVTDALQKCLPAADPLLSLPQLVEGEPLDRSNYLKAVFSLIDADTSGKIDLSEFRIMSQKQSSKSLLIQEEIFRMMDINNDGVVSEAEFVIFQMEHGHHTDDATFKEHADSWVGLAKARGS